MPERLGGSTSIPSGCRDGGESWVRPASSAPRRWHSHAPIGQREDVSEDPPRWLIYRRTDGTQAYGQIVDRDEGRYLVELGGELREVPKDSGRPRPYEVTSESLELLRLRDPDAIQKRFAEDQVGTIVAVLADRKVSRTKDDLVNNMKRLGVDVDDKTWKSLQPKLAKHPNIGREGTPVTYRWKEADTADESPDELLSRALSTRSPKEKSDTARSTLARLCREESLTPTQRALAVVAGVEGAVLPAWEDVSLDGLEERLADVLLDRAAAEQAWAFLAGIALDPGRPARAARAAELLLAGPAEKRDAHIAAALRKLAAEIPTGADLSPNLELIDRRRPLVERALGDRATQPALGGLVALAFAVPRDTTAELAASLRRWALVTAAKVASSRAALASALESSSPSAIQRAVMATVLGGEPFDPDGPRIRWLASLSKWQPTAPELYDKLVWWTGLGLDDLPVVNDDPDLGPILRSELGRQRLLPSAIERTLSADPSSLARVLALPDAIVSAVDPGLVVEAGSRLPPDQAISTMVNALGAMAKEAAERRHASEMDAVRVEHEHAIKSLRNALDEQARAAASAAARRDAIAGELDELRGHQLTRSDAHRRQAQLEALRAVADLVQEVRSSMTAVAAGTIGVEEVDRRLLRLAEDVGVVVDAPPGAEIRLNRALYRPIGDDPDEGALVRVVEPAYVTRAGGGVTPLRYGYVEAVNPTEVTAKEG